MLALLAIEDDLERDKVDTRGGTKEVEHEAPLPVEARCRLLEHEGVAEVGECPNDRVLRCHRDVAQLGHGALAEPCERGAVEPERAQAVVERVNEAGDIWLPTGSTFALFRARRRDVGTFLDPVYT